MERVGVKKVRGGKLLKVKVVEEDGIIKEARISGDFFVHPEEAVEEIEGSLKNVNMKRVREVLKDFERKRTLRTVGFSLEDIAEIIERWCEDV